MEEIIKRLDKILYWLEFIGKKELKEYLLSFISDPKELILYQNSDGLQGYRELTEKANMTEKTIQNYWNKWEKLGIIEKISVQRGERGKRKYDLIELGINIPEIQE